MSPVGRRIRVHSLLISNERKTQTSKQSKIRHRHKEIFLKFQTLWIIHTGTNWNFHMKQAEDFFRDLLVYPTRVFQGFLFASVNWIRASRWKLLEMCRKLVSVLWTDRHFFRILPRQVIKACTIKNKFVFG